MPAPRFRPTAEELGPRTLPAVTLVGNVLKITGTDGDDVITVDPHRPSFLAIRVEINGRVTTVPAIGVDIEIRGLNGDDSVDVDPFLPDRTLINGGRGADSLVGGGGATTFNGGRGADRCYGRGVFDVLNGGPGDDYLTTEYSGARMDGGPGDDLCFGGPDPGQYGPGYNEVIDGLDPDGDLVGSLSGPAPGTGTTGFGFRFGPHELERTFEVAFSGLGVEDGDAEVFLAGVPVGTVAVAGGAGAFTRTFDLDPGGAQVLIWYPAGVPEAHGGSVVEVKRGGTTVLSATLVQPGNVLVNPSFEDGGTRDPRSGWLIGGNAGMGADLFVNDTVADAPAYRPGSLGHFVGARAAGEFFWAAGADFGDGRRQALAQQFRSALTPDVSYTFTAFLRQSLDLAPGGYEVYLSPSSAYYDPGAVRVGTLAPAAGADEWLERKLTFAAPASTAGLPFLVLAPVSATPGTPSYTGIDLVALYRTP